MAEEVSCEHCILDEAIQKMGLEAQKPKQKEAVMPFLAGSDVFVTLPTGYGISIIFAVLPGVFDRLKGNQYLPIT